MGEKGQTGELPLGRGYSSHLPVALSHRSARERPRERITITKLWRPSWPSAQQSSSESQ